MSLKQVAGGPSPAAIAETRANAKAAAGVSGKYAVVDGSDQAPNEFPYVPFAPDAYDDTASIKSAFAQSPAVGDNWVVPFTEQDAAYVKRQRDQVENADFDRWVMQKYDLSNPAELFLFQQIAPEQFQRRMDLIDYQQNLVSRYAKLRCMGARSLEDLKFEWLIETNRIELPKGPIWDPVAWMGAQTGNQATATDLDWARRGRANTERYMAGLFSPLGYLTEQQVGWNPHPLQRADIRGDPTRPTQHQLFKGSATRDSDVYSSYGSNPIRSSMVTDYDPARVGERFGVSPGAGGVRLVAAAGPGGPKTIRGYGRGGPALIV